MRVDYLDITIIIFIELLCGMKLDDPRWRNALRKFLTPARMRLSLHLPESELSCAIVSGLRKSDRLSRNPTRTPGTLKIKPTRHAINI